MTFAVALREGDEPGRVAIDGGGRAHVALRRGGAVLTLDLTSGAVLARREVCAAPRGVAWSAERGDVYVACAGGELVAMPPAGGAPTRTTRLDLDLRDVVPMGDRLLVTRLRSAETLVVDTTGAVTTRVAMTAPTGTAPGVARRAVPSPAGGAWVLHQRAGDAPVQVTSTGYYRAATPSLECAGTDGVTRPGLTWVRPPLPMVTLPDIPSAALAVDVAVDANATRVAVAVPGALGATTAFGEAPVTQLRVFSTTQTSRCLAVDATAQPSDGEVVAVAFAASRGLVAQTRAPAALFLADAGVTVALGAPLRDDPGHRLFHTNPTGFVACATCHVEGEDDGRVWTFAPASPRRTPYLRGGILGTEPFHWAGDLADIDALVREVMVRGMRAPAPDAAGVQALARWVDALPSRAAPAVAPDAVARGAALFRDPAVGCAGCHDGPHLTNGQTVDVGTGGSFQVPPLRGLAWHAPYLHNGCAATLRERFSACGGGDQHGHTSQLSAAQLDDLAAYLASL
ncbi:MAG: cytochrome c [Polyangiales bacterium]